MASSADREPARAGFDDRSLRTLLGHFPTGVVVVSAEVGGRPHGMSVNSFTSVSLRPPLVSFCAAHSSTTWPKLARADGFAISILGSQHEDLCRLFAQRDVDRYRDGSDWARTAHGHPVLADAVAWLDCTTVSTQPVGDHDLVIGEIRDGGIGEGDPLIFHRGVFTGLRHPS